MFERFTERARQVIVLSQEEAKTLKHNYIGTEHLLLGLVYEREGLAAQTLSELGVEDQQVRAEVKKIVGTGTSVVEGQIPFTPRAKKILELSLREALSLGHNYIGTEHLLMGFLREPQGVGMRILVGRYDLSVDKIRQALMAKLAASPEHIRSMSRAAGNLNVLAAHADKRQRYDHAISLARELNDIVDRLDSIRDEREPLLAGSHLNRAIDAVTLLVGEADKALGEVVRELP